MRTKSLILLCLVLALAGTARVPIALAWGPDASRAICLCATQVIHQETDRVLEGRELDLVAGATISDAAMTKYAVQTGDVEPFQSVIAQIALLRRANERGMTDYLAYRFGVLAKMTANTMQPFGIPKNEQEKKLKEKFDEDIEEFVEDLKPGYKHKEREFVYYPTSYFREIRRFLGDTEYFIREEYANNNGEYGEYTQRAVTKYFREAVDVVADVWYTVLSDRKYYAEPPPSPRDLTQYYAEQVDYFLKKSRPEKAEQAYLLFSEANPGLAEPYEVLGDAYYRAGDYERAMKEYRRGLSMKGNWPEVEDKIVGHYTRTGEALLAKKTAAGFQQAMQAFDEALEVSPGNPIPVKGRARARAEMEDLQARLGRDSGLLTAANQLYEEGGQAESAKEFAKAIDLYEKAAAVYSLVSAEFQDVDIEARDGTDDSERKIAGIFSAAIREAEGLIRQASEREDQGLYDEAIRFYDRVPGAVEMIKPKYTDQYNKAQQLIQSAERKKESAKTQLDTQKPSR